MLKKSSVFYRRAKTAFFAYLADISHGLSALEMTLFENEHGRFSLHKAFDVNYLDPVRHYVNWKRATNRWDDYDEYQRAIDFLAGLQERPSIWFDTHILTADDTVSGVLLIVGGGISSIENRFKIDAEEQSLLLKYFHIVNKGKGVGSFWLSSVIIPHYHAKKFRQIYVSSSHEQSFPFYERLGLCIADYQQLSDNRIFQRQGKCFVIKI